MTGKTEHVLDLLGSVFYGGVIAGAVGAVMVIVVMTVLRFGIWFGEVIGLR